MKNTLLILTVIILLLAGAHAFARQSPATDPASPCDEQAAAADKKKDAIEHDPLADPADELRIRAQKKLEEKNFKELQAAAAQLQAVSLEMNKEIDASGQYVISLRVLDDLDQIEKLAKKVRSRAK